MFSDHDTNVYSELGLEGPPDTLKDIKRAYARKLKQINQAKEPEAFQRLREVFERAQFEWKHSVDTNEANADLATGAEPVEKIEFSGGEEFTLSPQNADQSQEGTVQLVNERDTTTLSTLEENPLAGNSFQHSDLGVVDTQATAQLCSQIADLPTSPAGVEALIDILSSPQMEYAEARKAIEGAVYYYMQRMLTIDGENYPKFRVFVTDELLDAIELHFNWRSDVLSLQGKFFDSDELIAALLYNKRLYDYSSEEDDDDFEIDELGKWILKAGVGVFLLAALTNTVPSSWPFAETLSGLFTVVSRLFAAFASGYLIRVLFMRVWDLSKHLLRFIWPQLAPSRKLSQILSYNTLAILQLIWVTTYFALPASLEIRPIFFALGIANLLLIISIAILQTPVTYVWRFFAGLTRYVVSLVR